MEKEVKVKNRGTGDVGYTLLEGNIRRNWTPGEIKTIPADELVQASYIPGGLKLMQKYLIINDEELCEKIGIVIEPEYYYDENEIKTLLVSGSLEQLLDCLDFAPGGVLDIIKKVSVEIRLNDLNKREAIKKKLGFDITKAIENIDYSKENTSEDEQTKSRRANPISSVTNNSQRRTEAVKTPNYKRV